MPPKCKKVGSKVKDSQARTGHREYVRHSALSDEVKQSKYKYKSLSAGGVLLSVFAPPYLQIQLP